MTFFDLTNCYWYWSSYNAWNVLLPLYRLLSSPDKVSQRPTCCSTKLNCSHAWNRYLSFLQRIIPLYNNIIWVGISLMAHYGRLIDIIRAFARNRLLSIQSSQLCRITGEWEGQNYAFRAGAWISESISCSITAIFPSNLIPKQRHREKHTQVMNVKAILLIMWNFIKRKNAVLTWLLAKRMPA